MVAFFDTNKKIRSTIVLNDPCIVLLNVIDHDVKYMYVSTITVTASIYSLNNMKKSEEMKQKSILKCQLWCNRFLLIL